MLTDPRVVIEDCGANATSFDRKASEVAKAPTRAVQFPAIYFARATRFECRGECFENFEFRNGTGNFYFFSFSRLFPESCSACFSALTLTNVMTTPRSLAPARW